MSNLDLFRRKLGRFKVSKSVIENTPEDIMKILVGVIPVRAEYKYEDACIHYVGLSNCFDIINSGLMPPRYVPTIENNTVTWKRIDE